ncbi:MAG: alpha/beta fold hydrolase [Pseudonocardiaceae bacterium]|nr:alpha/beta fold hydrolase [Pseudonocardiaceae bacterium]
MSRLLRHSRRAAVLPPAILLLLAGCTAPSQTPAEIPGPVPGDLDRFYGQQISWAGCGDFATSQLAEQAFAAPGLQCARVQVPLDYDEPGGRTASVALLRRPASDPEARIGSLLVNPGGPGGSGLTAAASMTGAVEGTELGRRFDLVGFDPRGVGASEPAIDCRNTAEQDAERLDNDLDTSPAGVAQTEAEERAYAQLCAERVGEQVLANVGSADVARDMDVLRAVLGDEKLTYLGYSYGTRIGTEYAEQFPGNVRAMVLDGAVDPNEPLVESLVKQGAGFQSSFDAFIDWCLPRQGCWTDGPVPATEQQFQDLIAPLAQQPLPVGNRQLSYSDAETGTIQALYSDRLWPVLDQGLAGLARGDGSLLLALADLYYQRDPSGYTNSEDAFTAVHCVDDVPITDRAAFREADRRYREVAPFLDDGNPPSAARDACAFWPVPGADEPGMPQVEGVEPPLVISTTGDPATPYQAGVELTGALGGRLLTFEGNQHTVALQGVGCVDTAVTRYLVDGTLPPEGMRCAP